MKIPKPENSSRTTRLICRGQSMRPVIQDGDEITLIRIPAEQIRFGDIIACQKNDGLMTHRFLHRRTISGKTFVVTKGDNCSNCDEPLNAAAVWGKAIEIRRNGESINLQTPSWRMICFMTAMFSFLEWKIYQMVAGKRGLSPGTKRNIKALIKGPKEFLFRILILTTGGK